MTAAIDHDNWPHRLPALVALLLGLAIAIQPFTAIGESAPDSLARLAPTSSPPWNPPRAVARSQPWETVVRIPGQIVAIPFSLIGFGMKGGLTFVEQNDVIPKVAAHISVLARYGLVAGPANLGDHTGTGGELGINPTFFRSLAATLSGSTQGYNRVSVAVASRHGRIEYQNDWRPRDTFFGVGLDSREEDLSNFAIKSQQARLELRHVFQRQVVPRREVLEDPAASTVTHNGPRSLLRAWVGPRDIILLDGREKTADRLPLSERFPTLAAEQLETRVEHFIYGVQAAFDSRSGRPHWWRGWRAAATGERYDKPLDAFAFHSASTPSVVFTRWTYEGEAALSFWRDPRTIRVYGRVVDQTDVDTPGLFLLPDLPTLGGGEGPSGFEPGRFRDPDLALGRITYIFPIARYLEGDLHAEGGSVNGRLEEARLADVKTSYGFALRVRNAFAPLGFVGLDWSREKIRFRFSIGGVE